MASFIVSDTYLNQITRERDKARADAARLRAALEEVAKLDASVWGFHSAEVGDALAASPSDTLDALEEAIAAGKRVVKVYGKHSVDACLDRLRNALDNPLLAWLRRT